MSLVTGYVLQNRYRIVKLVGQGGFGAVYRAWDLTLRQPVAVKENFGLTVAAQHQFEREAIILAGLRHPSLPRVIDHFVVPSQGQYLVMDFVEGKSLEELLNERGGPLAESEVLPWVRQVCDALDYLHRLAPPVIHRDIKPQNIIITPDSRAILVDFGISKVYDPSTSTTVGARAVTPGYSAPENYGTGRTDPRSDVYALAATLYTLLTGQVPPDSVDLMTGQATLTPLQALNAAVSPTTARTVAQAMEPNTRHRTPDVATFRADLTGIGAGAVGTEATSPSAAAAATAAAASTATAGAPPRRTPTWVWFLGAVAVAAALWLAVRLSGGGANPTPTPFSTTPLAIAGETNAEPTVEPTAAPTDDRPEPTAIAAAVATTEPPEQPSPTEESAPQPTATSTSAPPIRINPQLTIETDTGKTMGELLAGDPNFTIFVEALRDAELTEPTDDFPGTIFAPPNAAFEMMDQAQLQAWLADPNGDMARILEYHMLGYAASDEDIAAVTNGRISDTLSGEPLITSEFNIIAPDIQASNGVIHVIDAVQVPPTISNAIQAEQLLDEGIPVLRVWADDIRAPALRDIETAFEAEYGAELLIDEVSFGDIRVDLLTAGPAGKGPDIILGAHDWLGELHAGGVITPIDLGDRAGEFAPAAIRAFTYAGELYGMPVNTENVALFINTDLVTGCPATWTAVRQTSARLHAIDSRQYGFVRMEGDPYHFYPIQSAFGGYVFARDETGGYDPTQVGIGDPGSIAAAQWYENMVAEGLQPPAMDWDTMHLWFESGQAAMIITGPWATDRIVASGVPFQICDIPGEIEEAGRPFMGAQGFMISAFANDPLLAQIFLTEFVATPKVMAAMYALNPRPPAFLETLEAVEDEYIAAFGRAGANADPMPTIPEMASVWDAWGNAVILISQGADTAQNAFSNAQRQIESAISGG